MQKHNISGKFKRNKIIFCLALAALLLTSCNSKNTNETAPDTSADTQTEVPEESIPVLTESDIDEVMQRYFKYEEYTVYSSVSMPTSAETVEMDNRVFNRVTDERFDDWNEWLDYIGTIYCGDLFIEKIEGQIYFTGVDGKTYVMTGEMGWYISQEYTSEYSANGDGSYNVKIFRNKKNPGFDDIICEYNYIFTHTDEGWRISDDGTEPQSTPYEDELDLYGIMERYLEYEKLTVYASSAMPMSEENVQRDNRTFYKVTDERFDTWDEWLAFAGSIYCGDLLEEKLENEDKYINVDGFTYVMPGDMGWYTAAPHVYEPYETADGTCTVKVHRKKENPGEDSTDLVYNFTFTETDSGWRISGESIE